MLNYFDNGHLYTLKEMQHAALSPFNLTAKMAKKFYRSPFNPFFYTGLGRSAAAAFELMERMTRKYSQPEWEIESTTIGGNKVAVTPVQIKERNFCELTHFKKDSKIKQPKLLLVAPLSGHFATLCRGTIEGLLPHFDVYTTEWINASDVPPSMGPFTFDNYVSYVMRFLYALGERAHVLAVCQPSVPVMAAVSVMSAKGDPFVPKTMTLIGGPIDTRVNPTQVNTVAKERPMEWFEQNVISYVPANYPGFMRRVYPGFVQLTGFMTMNLDRHIGEHMNLFMHLVDGDGESADSHRDFYNEYLAVMDLPAEFYLETVDLVFRKHALPRGELTFRGRRVRPETIKDTAILCIEGERDDISGVGQTKAALEITTGLSPKKKHYHLQKDVGHYGTFNGRRFREHIVPLIADFAKKHEGDA